MDKSNIVDLQQIDDVMLALGVHKRDSATYPDTHTYVYIYIYTRIHTHIWASLVSQTVKNLPAVSFNPWVRKIPLEEGKATHARILAWRIPWTV